MSTGLPTIFDTAYFGEPTFPVRRFTVAEYLRMSETGILTEDDSVELLEGLIVPKMPKNPRHDATIDILTQLLWKLLPAGWYPRDQKVLLMTGSAPEPDIAIVRGQPRDYWRDHPTSAAVALVIEVADSSLDRDRRKRRIYAGEGIAAYWIMDVQSNQVEVFTQPNAAAKEYRQHDVAPFAAPISLSLPDGGVVTLPLDTALDFV